MNLPCNNPFYYIFVSAVRGIAVIMEWYAMEF